MRSFCGEKKNKIPFDFFFCSSLFGQLLCRSGCMASAFASTLHQAKSFFFLFGSNCDFARSLNTLSHRQSIPISQAKPATLSWPDSSRGPEILREHQMTHIHWIQVENTRARFQGISFLNQNHQMKINESLIYLNNIYKLGNFKWFQSFLIPFKALTLLIY